MWIIFKVFIESVTILLLFYTFWLCGPEACRILAPQPGIKPIPPALEDSLNRWTAREVLTQWYPDVSLEESYLKKILLIKRDLEPVLSNRISTTNRSHICNFNFSSSHVEQKKEILYFKLNMNLTLNNNPPLISEGYIPRSAVDAWKCRMAPNTVYTLFFLYLHIPMIKVNLQIRHSKRLTTITNNEFEQF